MTKNVFDAIAISERDSYSEKGFIYISSTFSAERLS